MNLQLHLIINYQAGSGNGKKIAATILAALDKKQIPYQTYPTEYQGHGIVIAQKLLKSILIPWQQADSTKPFPLLVVLGGDGTLHEAVNALGQQFDIPLGYIPAGSGNDFARGVGLSREPLKALEHLLKLSTPKYYTILAYQENNNPTRHFITNNLGIGLDAAIVAEAHESKSKQRLNKFNLGSLIYLLAAFKVLAKQGSFPVTMEVDGATFDFENAYLCTTTNHPFFGGGLAIAPEASVHEADMEIVLVERINLFKILHLIYLLLRKKHLTSKHVYHFKTSSMRLSSPTEQYIQVDGEMIPPQALELAFKPETRLFWV